ncbi:hypothetical protein NUW58_g7758 [Xylaria curta]|uniref:Uncharacterized protein n=1 Tax=Xylaria curta TaxID=42375 RepID=A0ACC1NEA0_9PEZI|nr:hypothetical protein NUW58_g7758 [Xylaria curta]
MMRMFQGILALTVVEPGMIRLLPSPKLSTVYFLLRPFFSPKEPAPEPGDGADKWERYLDPANWALDREQSTIIHGAVPGHAQRVTAAWHPHLQLDKSLVTPPTLQAGDYIVWHPDQAYQFSNTNCGGVTPTANKRPSTKEKLLQEITSKIEESKSLQAESIDLQHAGGRGGRARPAARRGPATARRLESGWMQGGAAGAGIGAGIATGIGMTVGSLVSGLAAIPTTGLGILIGAGTGLVHGPWVKFTETFTKDEVSEIDREAEEEAKRIGES